MYASQEKKNLKVKGKQMDKRVESVERAMAPAFQDFPSKLMPQHACIPRLFKKLPQMQKMKALLRSAQF